MYRRQIIFLALSCLRDLELQKPYPFFLHLYNQHLDLKLMSNKRIKIQPADKRKGGFVKEEGYVKDRSKCSSRQRPQLTEHSESLPLLQVPTFKYIFHILLEFCFRFDY